MLQQFDQCGDVVSAHHCSEQLHRLQRCHQRAGRFALGDGTQPGCFDIGGFIHSRGNAIAQQVQQGLFFPRRWLLKKFR